MEQETSLIGWLSLERCPWSTITGVCHSGTKLPGDDSPSLCPNHCFCSTPPHAPFSSLSLQLQSESICCLKGGTLGPGFSIFAWQLSLHTAGSQNFLNPKEKEASLRPDSVGYLMAGPIPRGSKVSHLDQC